MKIDIFYMLSNWLMGQGKKLSQPDIFKSIILLLKMYLIGIYTEDDSERRQEMVGHFQVCTNTFDDEALMSILRLVHEASNCSNIKQFLKIEEDRSMDDVLQQSKTWT